MIGLLQTIVDDFVCWIETGIILFVNFMIIALGTIVGAVIAVLPSMSTLGTVPSWLSDGYNYACYYLPVDFLLALGASFVVFYLAWMVIAVVLRWAKIISGNA